MGKKLPCEHYVKLARKGLLNPDTPDTPDTPSKKKLCNDARRACHSDKINNNNYKSDDWHEIQQICDKDERYKYKNKTPGVQPANFKKKTKTIPMVKW